MNHKFVIVRKIINPNVRVIAAYTNCRKVKGPSSLSSASISWITLYVAISTKYKVSYSKYKVTD
jgi:hypothetical protein